MTRRRKYGTTGYVIYALSAPTTTINLRSIIAQNPPSPD